MTNKGRCFFVRSSYGVETSAVLAKMNGVSGYDSGLKGYTGPGTIWVNGMNFGMKHAPRAGLIARPVDL